MHRAAPAHPFFARTLLALLAVAPSLGATDYGVSASKGNDSNPGTLARPFKTLTKAFGIAKNGDRVFVFPGRYSPTLGEKYLPKQYKRFVLYHHQSGSVSGLGPYDHSYMIPIVRYAQ